MSALTLRVQNGVGWLELDLPGEPLNKITPGVSLTLTSGPSFSYRENPTRSSRGPTSMNSSDCAPGMRLTASFELARR